MAEPGYHSRKWNELSCSRVAGAEGRDVGCYMVGWLRGHKMKKMTGSVENTVKSGNIQTKRSSSRFGNIGMLRFKPHGRTCRGDGLPDGPISLGRNDPRHYSRTWRRASLMPALEASG